MLEIYAKKLQGLPGLGDANVQEHEETLADLSNALFEVLTRKQESKDTLKPIWNSSQKYQWNQRSHLGVQLEWLVTNNVFVLSGTRGDNIARMWKLQRID